MFRDRYAHNDDQRSAQTMQSHQVLCVVSSQQWLHFEQHFVRPRSRHRKFSAFGMKVEIPHRTAVSSHHVDRSSPTSRMTHFLARSLTHCRRSRRVPCGTKTESTQIVAVTPCHMQRIRMLAIGCPDQVPKCLMALPGFDHVVPVSRHNFKAPSRTRLVSQSLSQVRHLLQATPSTSQRRSDREQTSKQRTQR